MKRQTQIAGICEVLLILVVFFFLSPGKIISAAIDPNYVACKPRNCGNNSLNITFPFYIQDSSCGFPEFEVSCNKEGKPTINISENDYVIDQISYKNRTFSVHNAAILSSDSICDHSQQLKNVTPPTTPFEYFNEDDLYLLLNCTNSTVDKLQDYKVVCAHNEYKDGLKIAMLKNDVNLNYALKGCSKNVVVPVEAGGGNRSRNGRIVDYVGLLSRGFSLKWKDPDCSECEESGGHCGFNNTSYDFRCFCPDKPHRVSCRDMNSKRWMLIVFPLAIVLISILAIYLCYLCCARIRRRRLKEEEKRRRDDIIHQLTGSDSFNYGDELEKDIKDAPNVKIFSLKAVLTATNNFSNENKLGQGGYGPVYKGILQDGREIAVKKLSKTSGQGIGEFKNELILITKLQHTNLVRLYGCCIHQEEKMLVYEFMPNKSLDFFLFVDDKKEKIDWQIRFNIIEGVAQGMLYLHKYSRMKVIHRDLKVSNVLLDENMNPKIADFGMARIFQQNVTEAMTNRVVGTYGYMAPEYAMEGTFSIKSDVFSFGVLILEIVSGKKNLTLYNLDKPLNLVGYAWELWKGQAALELKDETLGESCDVKQLLRATHVGLLCVQEDADDRPTMSEVISMLNNEIADLPNPKKPAFFTGRQVVEVGSPGTRPTDYLLDEIVPISVNGLTITTMEAR